MILPDKELCCGYKTITLPPRRGSYKEEREFIKCPLAKVCMRYSDDDWVGNEMMKYDSKKNSCINKLKLYIKVV